jgi:hypothetical protein
MGRPIGLEDERAFTRCRWVAIGCESSRGCGSEGGVCFLDSRVAASAPGPVTPNPGDPWTMGCPDPGNLRGPRPPLRWSAGAAVLPAALSGLNRSPLQPRPSALPTDRHRSAIIQTFLGFGIRGLFEYVGPGSRRSWPGGTTVPRALKPRHSGWICFSLRCGPERAPGILAGNRNRCNPAPFPTCVSWTFVRTGCAFC